MAAQPRFSIATDLSVQRNLKEDQRFWALGQTVHVHFHLTPKEGVYVWFTYYSKGHYRNDLTATAKQSTTIPSSIDFVNKASMRLKHFSVGYKRYLKGSSESESGMNIYVFAGFGLMLGRVENQFSKSIDTTQYFVPVYSGVANFKRLTIDPGLGIEHYLSADISAYAETRVWLPTTDYPSNYIFVNNDAPWTVMFSAGFRVLF